jgi:hypothetical protein
MKSGALLAKSEKELSQFPELENMGMITRLVACAETKSYRTSRPVVQS